MALGKEPSFPKELSEDAFSLFKQRLFSYWAQLSQDAQVKLYPQRLEMAQLCTEGDVWALLLVKAFAPQVPADTRPTLQADSHEQIIIQSQTQTTNQLDGRSKRDNYPAIPLRPMDTVNHQDTLDKNANSSATSVLPELAIPDAKLKIRMAQKIGWTTHKRNWMSNVTFADHSLTDSARQFIASCGILVPSNPICFAPEGLLLRLLGSPTKEEKLLSAIRTKSQSPQAFALVSPPWLRQPDITRPRCHVCDIFVLSDSGHAYFWTVFVESELSHEMAELYSYAIEAVRCTKEKLPGQTAAQAFSAECYLYNTTRDQIQKEPELQQYMKSFLHNQNDLKHVQAILVELIVREETPMKNAIGEACGYKLSAQQQEVILKREGASVIVIHGPPGSGKTLLASHMLQQSDRPSDGLYICTNEALKMFMKTQNSSEAVVVKSDKDVSVCVKYLERNPKACIIFDDAHTISCSDRVVQQLLTLIDAMKACRFYVFTDNRYQCFMQLRKDTFSETVLRCCRQMRIPCSERHLDEIHRNTRKVMSFLAATTGGRELRCLNQWDGDEVEVIAAADMFKDSSDNVFVKHIRDATGITPNLPPNHKQYSMCDIAILVDTMRTGEDILGCKRLMEKYVPGSSVQTASKFPRKGVVVDSVDSFGGLDAAVCFFVLAPSRMERKSKFTKFLRCNEGHRSIYNPKYTAFLASRAIHRAVFVLPELNFEVFKTLLFDSFTPQVSTCVQNILVN